MNKLAKWSLAYIDAVYVSTNQHGNRFVSQFTRRSASSSQSASRGSSMRYTKKNLFVYATLAFA